MPHPFLFPPLFWLTFSLYIFDSISDTTNFKQEWVNLDSPSDKICSALNDFHDFTKNESFATQKTTNDFQKIQTRIILVLSENSINTQDYLYNYWNRVFIGRSILFFELYLIKSRFEWSRFGSSIIYSSI